MSRRIKVGSPSSDTLRHTCQGGSCQDIKARRLFRLLVSSSVPQLTVLLNFEILSGDSNHCVYALFWGGGGRVTITSWVIKRINLTFRWFFMTGDPHKGCMRLAKSLPADSYPVFSLHTNLFRMCTQWAYTFGWSVWDRRQLHLFLSADAPE